MHIILGIIFSAVLFLLFPQIKLMGFLIVFLSSVLIDVDHYVYYFFKKKDWSLINAYKWHVKNWKKYISLSRPEKFKVYSGWYFLHGIEAITLFLMLGLFVSKYFLFIFIGFLFHFFIDLYDEISLKGRIIKISMIYDFFTSKKLKTIEEF